VTVVGQRVRAIGWDARTSGTDAYSADLPFTDVLVGRILRSPHPYAEIVSIDTARADRMPGVRAVITTADFPKGARYIHSGGETSDRGPLADGMVRYVGEEVAAVAADTEEQAEAALAEIRVRYRPKKAPLTIDEALKPGALAIHTRKTGETNVSLKSAGSVGRRGQGTPRGHRHCARHVLVPAGRPRGDGAEHRDREVGCRARALRALDLDAGASLRRDRARARLRAAP
jgi:CO/xanthine dehydrogenase Mo-binding subunit